MNTARRWLATAAGAAITAVCATAVYRSLTPEAMSALGSANPAWIALALTIGLAGMAVRSERWRALLLQGGARVGAMQAFWTSSAGQMINTFMPARMGDAYRGLAAAPAGSRAFSMGTIVVERVLDTGVVLLAAMGALAVAPEVAWWIRPSVAMLAVGVFGAVACLAALPRAAGKILTAIEGRWPARRAFASELIDGMLLVWKPWAVVRFLLLSVAAWSFDALGLTVLVRACSASLDWSAGLLLVTLLAFASAIPATGMVGVAPIACAYVLPRFGVPKPQAVAVGILLQTLGLLLYAVTGGIGLWILRNSDKKGAPRGAFEFDRV